MEKGKVDTKAQNMDSNLNVLHITKKEAITLNLKLQGTRFRLWTEDSLLDNKEQFENMEEKHNSAINEESKDEQDVGNNSLVSLF